MAGRLHGSICRDRDIAGMAAGGCRDVAGRDWRRGIHRILPLQLGPMAGGCGRRCRLRRATLTVGIGEAHGGHSPMAANPRKPRRTDRHQTGQAGTQHGRAAVHRNWPVEARYRPGGAVHGRRAAGHPQPDQSVAAQAMRRSSKLQVAAMVQRSLAQEVIDPIYSRWLLSGSCVAGGSSGSKPLRMTAHGGSSSVAVAWKKPISGWRNSRSTLSALSVRASSDKPHLM